MFGEARALKTALAFVFTLVSSLGASTHGVHSAALPSPTPPPVLCAARPSPSLKAGAYLNGTVLNVTGHLIALQGKNDPTIRVAYVPGQVAPSVVPGVNLSVVGELSGGLIRASAVQVCGGTPWPTRTIFIPPAGHIDHIIFVVQENHSFDNYFGTYPGADGFPKLSSGQSLPGCSPNLAPFHYSTVQPPNLDHSWKNRGWPKQRATLPFSDLIGKTQGSYACTHAALGFFDGRDIPNYWAYAQHFTLADHFFSSLMGPTMPNRFYTVAGQSDGVITNVSKPPPDGFDVVSLPQVLSAHGISWKYYVGAQDPQAFSPFNPLPGIRAFHQNPGLRSHLVRNTQYFQDLRQGTLPAVSWLAPDMAESEHPPGDIQVGMWYVTSVVNALMESPYWNDSVVIVTYDEAGGFYDHVVPPLVDQYGFGERIPALIISPYARAGVVDHTVYSHASVLRLIENRFDLASIGKREAEANSIGTALNLRQRPLAPFEITQPLAPPHPVPVPRRSP